MYYMASRLGEWLIVELKKRGWSQRELARRAGLTSGTVSNMINGLFEPDITTLAAIANGLKVPKETVFREAGVLANSQYENHIESELLYLFRLLPQNDQEHIMNQLQATVIMLDQQGKIKDGR